MSDSKFTTQGNEPLEARIVSWVLGEASDFEVEELQRLCDEQPELAVFKRRMEAVHGIAAEAGRPRSEIDAAWKLSPTKRAEIEKLIGPETVSLRETARERRVRRSGRQAILAIAACLVLTLVVATLTWPLIMGSGGFVLQSADVEKSEAVIVSYSYEAMEGEPDADESRRDAGILGRKAKNMVPLSEVASGLPAELIEGTPRPMKVPGLVDPSASPAMKGLAKKLDGKSNVEWAKRRTTESNAPAPREAPARFAAGGMRAEKEASPKKPASPSASVADVITSTAGSEVAVPVPAGANLTMPSVDFGESDDFGSGWGGGSGGAGGGGPMPERGAGNRGNSHFYAERDTNSRQFAGPDDDLSADFRADKDMSGGPLDSLSGLGDSEESLQGQSVDPFADESGLASLEDAKFSTTSSREKAMTTRELDRVEVETKFVETNQNFTEELKFDLLDAEAGESELRVAAEKRKREAQSAQVVDVKRPVATEEETIAAEEPYSTFSLNINDASFRIAQAALAKGEMPDPAAIKVEQFYNAVDYGDPAPAAGLPVSSTIDQSAHPVIPGRNLVRIAIKTASEGRNQGQPLRLTLLIDQSGSMAREDRRQSMIEALEGLRGLLTEQDQVHVIGFARTPHLLAEALPGNQGAKLPQLINIEANEGGTNLEEAIKLGEQLAERHQLEGAQNRIVLFTDGAANLGDADPESLANKIKELRQAGFAFDIAGIAADGLNDDLLGELARHGNGRYYVVGKGETNRFAEQLAGAFRPAAENVKVQVHFNPERVGRYKLIGFEKDRLNKEDFRNDAVDAAELAAEEAGVAVYQVETLPEGEGEIGEVSVRFRDVASGRMVERTWTVAHDAAAPALDRARPAMQLAVLSMLAGEKLKNGPLSDAINFNDMAETLAKVAQHYRGDGRVAEMLQLIDQLK